MKRLLPLLLFAVLAFAACQKNNSNDEQPTQLIFGKSYGECVGNCATLYKVYNGQLYPDNLSYFYYGGELKFSNTSLSNEKYNIAKQLLDNFPAYLKNLSDSSFGCPDCHDQGAIYIQFSEKGVIKKWNIDPVESRQPDEIKAYIQQLNAVMTQLQ
ncbi:MAG: hypothetical protein QM731_09050 [Chitinophagaceae bacterium]